MFIIFYILFLLTPLPVSADTGHLVISEIQAYGQTATDEFVRVYNSTASAVDISGWKLTKKTSSGSESNLVSSFTTGTIIPPGSGFLIAHQTGYQGTETPNTRYSGASYSFADNNTIILKDGSGAIIDKVGFGTATDFESAPAQNPENGQSIKRQNNQDTGNNALDFSADGETAAPPASSAPPAGSAPSSAEYGDIVINEIIPNPDEGKEWIELLNISTKTFNLSGWKISDGSSVIDSLEGELLPENFLTVEISSRLNNSGDAVYLSDASGKSIFQLIYGDWASATISAPEKGQSLARLPAPDAAGYGGQARDANKNYQITNTPTKNTINLFTKSIATADDSVNGSGASPSSTTSSSPADFSFLSIIEILPNPAGSDTENEYLKIKNSLDTDIDLGGLYLDDAEGGSNPHKILTGTIIKAGEEIIFYRSKTKIALNNTDDEARILSPSKEEIFSIDYEDAEESAIYIFKNGKWGWNFENKKSPSTPPLEKGETGGFKNSITAVVIATPNTFSTQTMYVDGLQLYMYSKDWPELAMGDKIYAYGTPSTYYGEPRLKLKNKNSIKIISRNNAVEPTPADGLAEDDLGRLIIMEGEVLQIANTKTIIDINGEEISIYDKTKQKLFSQLKEKDSVQITGIISQYKDEFRLLPRGADDIKVIQTAAAPLDKKAPIWQYAISTLAIGAFAGAIYWRRRKNGNTGTAQPLG